MTTLLWTLIAIQVAMAAFDTIYHHELTERLAWRPSQKHELTLHAARSLLYVLLFCVLGFFRVHGLFAFATMAVLVVETVYVDGAAAPEMLWLPGTSCNVRLGTTVPCSCTAAPADCVV